MGNKLFLVCPFSRIENFIKRTYGDDVFFLTSMGAIFQFREKEYIEAINKFICHENITEIWIVSDISCRFINSALKNELGYGSYSETVIEKRLMDNYNFVMKESKIDFRQIRLAELIVNFQANELMNIESLTKLIHDKNIQIRKMVVSKKSNQIFQPTIKQ